jgi:capsular polysaccharide biosynthesis protein
MFAGAVAVGLAFLMNFLDSTVQDEVSIEEEFGLPVLATIQHYGT